MALSTDVRRRERRSVAGECHLLHTRTAPRRRIQVLIPTRPLTIWVLSTRESESSNGDLCRPLRNEREHVDTRGTRHKSREDSQNNHHEAHGDNIQPEHGRNGLQFGPLPALSLLVQLPEGRHVARMIESMMSPATPVSCSSPPRSNHGYAAESVTVSRDESPWRLLIRAAPVEPQADPASSESASMTRSVLLIVPSTSAVASGW